MKKTTFLIFATALICGLFAMFTVSCSHDDEKPAAMLKFNPFKAEVQVGATTSVAITGGTAPYTVKAGNEKVATATVDKNIITVTGVKKGTTSILVTDKNKLSRQLPVIVKNKEAALDFDKKTLHIAVGKEDVVVVIGGVSPYIATVKDPNIATASVKGANITIKGLKAGTTTVVITDKNKLSGMITVTVK